MVKGHIICYDGYKQDMSEKNRRNRDNKDNKEGKNLRAAVAFGEQMYEMMNNEPDTTEHNQLIQTHHISYDDDEEQPATKRQKINIHERMLIAKQAMKQQKSETTQDKFNIAFRTMALTRE